MSNELQTSNMINELYMQIKKAESDPRGTAMETRNSWIDQIDNLLKKPNFIYCEDCGIEKGKNIAWGHFGYKILCDYHIEMNGLAPTCDICMEMKADAKYCDQCGLYECTDCSGGEHVCEDNESEPKTESFDYNIAENIIEAEKSGNDKEVDYDGFEVFDIRVIDHELNYIQTEFQGVTAQICPWRNGEMYDGDHEMELFWALDFFGWTKNYHSNGKIEYKEGVETRTESEYLKEIQMKVPANVRCIIDAYADYIFKNYYSTGEYKIPERRGIHKNMIKAGPSYSKAVLSKPEWG